MIESLAEVEKDFAYMSKWGHTPTELHKWEFEFFDSELARLKAFCACLVVEGFTFEKVCWNRDPGYQAKGWRAKIFEIKKHSPQSFFANRGLFEKCGCAQERTRLISYRPKAAPRTTKDGKQWESLWEKQISKEQTELSKPREKVPTPELDEFFARAERGQQQSASDWLPFVTLALRGKYFFLTDMRPGPSEDGLKVSLPAGEYELRVIAIAKGKERRIARLSGIQKGQQSILGKEIGKVSTDCATLGIYDQKNFQSLLMQGADVFYEWGEAAMGDATNPCGVLVHNLKKGAILPVVTSGFGDGKYPVFELTQNGQRVGFEVEFIPESKS